ncbi:MAG: hypothetical protein B6I36_07230 [Desulfobacteraceae bacterium 4572_35.1]|nr:MAG: hypothetical protein B6I36_07230 [Desulfobacteraceae bacterium 4572_35.1]
MKIPIYFMVPKLCLGRNEGRSASYFASRCEMHSFAALGNDLKIIFFISSLLLLTGVIWKFFKSPKLKKPLVVDLGLFYFATSEGCVLRTINPHALCKMCAPRTLRLLTISLWANKKTFAHPTWLARFRF